MDKKKTKPVGSYEIAEILTLPLESEDDLDWSDDDSVSDPTFAIDVIEDSGSDTSDRPTEIEIDEENEGIRKQGSHMSVSHDIKKDQIIWKNKNLLLPDKALEFRGNTSLPVEILSLDSPYQFFRYFFTDNIIDKICTETLIYTTQVDPSKPFSIDKNELRKFLGICIMMSIVHVPNTRQYWSDILGNKRIIDTMSVNKFETIRSNLHFNDNEKDDKTDRLYKIRPIVDALREKFLSIPMEKDLSIDEQLCATKARHFLKQYIPMKPHKWGYKLFILSGVSGFAYDFEVYTGAENNSDQRMSSEPDLGASANVVVRLSRHIPHAQNFQLFFDNYYTSVPLVVFLAKQGILSLGTVRRNRIPNCKLPSEAEMKNRKRGDSEEFVAFIDGVDVASVVWKDNKLVTLLSSFAGQLPIAEVQRYDKKEKKKVGVTCPKIIRIYNKHMGGVDLLDSFIGRHKIRMRSRKWYFRLFYHFLDMTMVNAWILYKRVLLEKQPNEKNIMKLSQFREDVADCLCRMGPPIDRKRGRPSSELEAMLLTKKSKPGRPAYIPPKDVRKDQYCHIPEWNESRQRCKMPMCKGQSYASCSKCVVALCFNKERNCFKQFHMK